MQRPRGRQFLPVRPEDEHRINRQIRVPQVRLIGVKGEQLGVVGTEEAIRMAQEAEVDLVEVAPAAQPRSAGCSTTASSAIRSRRRKRRPRRSST